MKIKKERKLEIMKENEIMKTQIMELISYQKCQKLQKKNLSKFCSDN